MATELKKHTYGLGHICSTLRVRYIAETAGLMISALPPVQQLSLAYRLSKPAICMLVTTVAAALSGVTGVRSPQKLNILTTFGEEERYDYVDARHSY